MQPRITALGPFSLFLLSDFQALEAPLTDDFRLLSVLRAGHDKIVAVALRVATGEQVVLRLRPLATIYEDTVLGTASPPTPTPYREVALNAARNQRAALTAFQHAGISLLNAEFELEWQLRRIRGLRSLAALAPANVPADLLPAADGDTLYLVSVSVACRSSMAALFPHMVTSMHGQPRDDAARMLAAAVGSYLLQVMAQLHLFRSVMPDFNHGDLWPRNVVLCRAPRPQAVAAAYVLGGRVVFYAPLLRNEADEAMVWRIIDMEFLSGTYRAPDTDVRLVAAHPEGASYNDLEALDQFVRNTLLAPGPGGWLHDAVADPALRNALSSIFSQSQLALVFKEFAAPGSTASAQPDVYAQIAQLVPLINGSSYYTDADMRAAEAAGRLEVVQLPPASTHVGARIAAALARKE